MEMAIQKVLVCGYGSIGKRHVRTVQKLIPGVEIAILRCNPNSTQKQSSYLEFIDVERALNWTPDCIIIANPAPFHVELALKSLRQSIPTFIDRDPDRFAYCLDYMRGNGKVYLPEMVSIMAFIDELKFFGFEDVDETKIVTLENFCS